MINTLSDLLKAFVEGEKAALNKYDIVHRPTIGEMYEGLTRELVSRSVFDGMNLMVTTQSFIEGCDTEFDVILAEGEGVQVPYTTSYRYKPSQVIAVIQVKKTLNAQELRNSYDNLRQVAKVFQENITAVNAAMANDAFKNICHKELSSYKRGHLNLQEEYIYHTLVMDCFFPLRIVLGYNGYKTEEGLRESYITYLEGNRSTEEKLVTGYSPMIFPNLIISDGFTLAKLTGCPYSTRLGSVLDGCWEVMVSSHYNPMRIFLEMLWTKLSYRFHSLPQEIFGDDLSYEPFAPLLRAKIHCDANDKPIGWDYEYTCYKEEQLLQNDDLQPWHPIIVNRAQFSVLRELQKHDIDLNTDKSLEAFVVQNGYSSLREFVAHLEQTGFVSVEGSMLILIANKLDFVFSPDGNTYAADNNDGRLSRWILKTQLKK